MLIARINPEHHAKKAVSRSLGLVDFASGLVNSVLNLPNGQVKLQKNCGLVKMTLGLVHAATACPNGKL